MRHSTSSWRRCARPAAAVEVVSDGVGFHVEHMLAAAGLTDLPVATNALDHGPGRVPA